MDINSPRERMIYYKVMNVEEKVQKSIPPVSAHPVAA